MITKTHRIGFVAGLAFVTVPCITHAGAAVEKALGNGAKQLTADQIAEQFVGQTGSWVSADNSKKIAIYYGPEHDLHGQMVDGDWSSTGYYGVADDNSICISWDGMDRGRLRCLDVLVVDGVVTKFNADGSLNGTYQSFADGKAF